MYAKKSGRITFRPNKRQGFKRSNSFSNGRVRNKGNVSQQYQKYIKLANVKIIPPRRCFWTSKR